jgi:pseudouridine-5'-phosphate glycosidase
VPPPPRLAPRSIRLTGPVAEAVATGAPIVVLESSVLAQGLPIPANREAAARMLGAVTSAGATPAVSAVVAGTPTLGLLDDELERFLRRDGVRKVSARDLAPAIVAGADGATTVAASLALATAAGLPVFATGGIGGVHRDAPFDESADLAELARSPVVTVCAGAKSILDLPATLERLETLGVTVVGFRTDRLPGFFTVDAGLPVTWSVDSAAEVADIYLQHRALGRREAILVVQPPPAGAALPASLVDEAVGTALAAARRDGIGGASVTPYLLAAVERATGGRSLGVNLALLESNARLAGEIAVALAATTAAVVPDL